VKVAGNEIQLTPNEYELLKVLVDNSSKVMTHKHLLNAVWGPEYIGEFHMLRVNISNLRRKIEIDPARPQIIITESGVGYRLKAD
jgi:two-component system KDP operon response regulator KdpE